MSLDETRELRQFAARDLDTGLLSPHLEPDSDLAELVLVWLLDRDVVDECDWIGTDADDIVHVHTDAINPDGVVAACLLSDHHLRADTICGYRNPKVFAD